MPYVPKFRSDRIDWSADAVVDEAFSIIQSDLCDRMMEEAEEMVQEGHAFSTKVLLEEMYSDWYEERDKYFSGETLEAYEFMEWFFDEHVDDQIWTMLEACSFGVAADLNAMYEEVN